MSVIVMDMKMPVGCWCCEFGKRWDNSSTLCERKPMESPVEDGCKRPSYCPLKEIEDDKEVKLY